MTKNEVIRQENSLISTNTDIKTMIYEIRGQRVMLDFDLAKLYGYTVKAFNQQVKNNIERFPDDFMLKLTKEEAKILSRSKILTLNVDSSRSQIATLNTTKRGSNIKYAPYAFTEQGVYALSGILGGSLATTVSINLIRAFKELKDLYNSNSYLLEHINDKLIEYQTITNNKLIEHGTKFDQIFDYISDHREVNEKIFYKGQIFDAFYLYTELIPKANKSIILIDNYIDNKTLNILNKKKKDVEVTIYTSIKGNKLTYEDIYTFNKQYSSLTVKFSNIFHDRFLILDNKTIYLMGASIKDAGKKCFGIVEIDNSNIKRIKEELK